MRIDSLIIGNFRCFEKEEWNFAPGFNVFIGDNGAGKTAALDALAIGIGTFFFQTGVHSRNIRTNDTRCVVLNRNEHPTLEFLYPTTISCFPSIHGLNVEVYKFLSRKGRKNQIINPDGFADILSSMLNLSSVKFDPDAENEGDSEIDKLIFNVRQNSHVVMKKFSIDVDRLVDGLVSFPMIVAYNAGRAWLKFKRNTNDLQKPVERLQGYENCLEAASDDAFLYDWFRTRELAGLQKGGVSETMQGVRATVVACLGEEWEQIWYDIDLGEIMAKRKDGTQLPVRLLSDGQRSILAMGLDMAYRAAVLNPHLAGKAAQETPGVVLIDELDLHLHPNWQRTIVPNLRRAFPKVQFFVTTHSPIILQGLDPKLDRVIRLNAPGPSTYPPVEDFIDKPLEDILMDVQDYPAFKLSERRQAMIAAAEKYYTVLKQAEKASDEELERLKQEMDELALPFHDNLAYIAFLNMERQAALGERN